MEFDTFKGKKKNTKNKIKLNCHIDIYLLYVFKYKFVPHYHINIVEFFFKTAFYFYKQWFEHNYSFMEVIYVN